MTQWTLVIPAPAKWLTSNQIIRMSKWERAELIRAWRGATVSYAVQARLPRGLARIEILGVAQFWGKPPVHDTENLRPTLKACVDGLGKMTKRTVGGSTIISPGYGLIADDDFAHLGETRLIMGESLGPAKPYGPTGKLTLTITEIKG